MNNLLPVTIVARKISTKIIEAKQILLQFFQSHKIPFQLDNHTHTLTGITPDSSPIVDLKTVTSGLLLSIGGDGSLLRLISHASLNHLPLIGLNLGRLGFLADLSLSELPQLLAILHGDYLLEQRDLLSVYLSHNTETKQCLGLALNDVLVKSEKPGKNIDFSVSIDTKHHFNHHADGFLISTPTGSTAYALSAGGPIIYPSMPAQLLLPICSHRLNTRPLVIPNTSKTLLTLDSLINRTASICIDGRPCGHLKPDMHLYVTRAPQTLTLIHSKQYNFFAVTRQKIQWESN